jgi:hypothetical protein
VVQLAAAEEEVLAVAAEVAEVAAGVASLSCGTSGSTFNRLDPHSMNAGAFQRSNDPMLSPGSMAATARLNCPRQARF